MYTFDDLALFAKVVEVGNFTHTGKLLKISHTTVSRRIKNLEEQLGAALIRVNNHSFEVTDIGKQVYKSVKDRIEEVGELINDVDNIVKQRNDPHGTLTVLLPTIMPYDLISPFIPAFIRQYPKINLNLCYQNREVNLVKNGFDIAIMNHVPRQQTLKIKNIYSSQYALYCTRAYAKKYGIPKNPSELADHLVTGMFMDDYTVPGNITLTRTKTGETLVIDMPKRLTLNNHLHVMQMVKTNEVIGALLSNLDVHLESSEFIHVLPQYSSLSVKYYLLRHPHGNDLKVKVFCDFIEQCLKSGKVD